MIRYDTKCLINRTEPTTKKWKTEKLKSEKRICSEVSVNDPGNPGSQSGRKRIKLRTKLQQLKTYTHFVVLYVAFCAPKTNIIHVELRKLCSLLIIFF